MLYQKKQFYFNPPWLLNKCLRINKKELKTCILCSSSEIAVSVLNSKVNCVPTLEVTQEDFLCWGFAFETQDYICIVTCEREKLKSPQLEFDLLSHLELLALLKCGCNKLFSSPQQLLMQQMSLFAKSGISKYNVA